MKHRALIVGCGRMGAGRDHKSPWVYTHIEAYRAFPERVEVVGFVDRVQARADWAAQKWGVPYAGDHFVEALKQCEPDIISICTPPSDRDEFFRVLGGRADIKGIWCEKPAGCKYGILIRAYDRKIPVQVNYIRRFDLAHQAIAVRRTADLAEMLLTADDAHLFWFGALDMHTVAHATDLADYWRIRKDHLHFIPFHGPSLYVLREPGPGAGRYLNWNDQAFIGGGVQDGFMQAGLKNLLDHIDTTAVQLVGADPVGAPTPLLSPLTIHTPENEAWAQAIVDHDYVGSHEFCE